MYLSKGWTDTVHRTIMFGQCCFSITWQYPRVLNLKRSSSESLGYATPKDFVDTLKMPFASILGSVVVFESSCAAVVTAVSASALKVDPASSMFLSK